MLMFSIHNSLQSCGTIPNCLGQLGVPARLATSFLILSVLAVITAMIIHATLLMFGRAFNLRRLRAYAKAEILQAGATVLMVALFITLVGGAMSLSETLITGQLSCDGKMIKVNGPDSGIEAIRCKLQKRAVEVAEIQEKASTNWLGKFRWFGTSVSIFGIKVLQGNWFSNTYQKTEAARVTNNLATTMLIALNSQSTVLKYIKENALAILVPLGILMRSFYFTRSPGAMLIALGIGFYFVFPTIYLLLDPGFIKSPDLPEEQFEAGKFCQPTMGNVATMAKRGGTQASGNVRQLRLNDRLSQSYINMLIHPLVSFFLTIFVVRYMVSILSGDVFALGKMVTKVV